MNEYVLLSL